MIRKAVTVVRLFSLNLSLRHRMSTPTSSGLSNILSGTTTSTFLILFSHLFCCHFIEPYSLWISNCFQPLWWVFFECSFQYLLSYWSAFFSGLLFYWVGRYGRSEHKQLIDVCREVYVSFELSIASMNNYGHALKLFQCSATMAVWSGQFHQVIPPNK